MNWLELAQQIFEVCVIPLLGVLAGFFIKWLTKQINILEEKSQNKKLNQYIIWAGQVVTDCVITTNQTYVEALKNKNAFDAEAQKQAFKMTYEAVMNLLTTEVKEKLSGAFGDISLYVTNLIEARVNEIKQYLPYDEKIA